MLIANGVAVYSGQYYDSDAVVCYGLWYVRLRLRFLYLPHPSALPLQLTPPPDDKNYANPTAFLPERWTPKGSNLIHEKDAFQSFSSGPYGCIGKNLALMELRTVTAALLDKFDISFAKGEDGRELLEETIDHFTLGLGGLWLKFEERK